MFIGSVLNAVMYCVFFAAVYKLFQIVTELGEVKDLLRDIRRNTNPDPPATRQTESASAGYTPPDLSILHEEWARDDRAYEVPADRITILDPPRS
jgi:hypothetical protein